MRASLLFASVVVSVFACPVATLTQAVKLQNKEVASSFIPSSRKSKLVFAVEQREATFIIRNILLFGGNW